VWCLCGVGYLPHQAPRLRRRRRRKRWWIEPRIFLMVAEHGPPHVSGSHAPSSLTLRSDLRQSLLANCAAGLVRSTEEFYRRTTVGTDRRSRRRIANSDRQLKLGFGQVRKRVCHFSTWTNERFIASVGIVLKDGPDRSCCWSSTLFSQEAKFTLNDAIAE
jgi:hypothetical protein